MKLEIKRGIVWDDCFLPSKDELNEIYVNLHSFGVGDFNPTGAYWASTETAFNNAAYQYFGNGNQGGVAKTNTYSVRACRSFTAGIGDYSLRDTGPAGGLIFYIDGTTYYEAAPSDQSASQAWSNITDVEIGTTSAAIGEGQNNTDEIIAQAGHIISAAILCDDLEVINEVVNVTVNIDERTVMSHRLLGEDVVNATFESTAALDIAIKDYIVHSGKTYTLNNLPQVKKLSSFNYEYTAVFESLQYQLLKTQYLSYGLSEFDLVGDADDFMDLIITNMNRVDSGWTKGTVKTTDSIHLTFREENCLAVIQRLATEFECEFELSTKEIKLTSIGEDTGLTFRYGRNKGLYDLTRSTVSSKNIITRLYAYGSERNLDKDYRDYSKRLMFAAAGSNYVENNVATYGLIEAIKIFEEVYPHREGTISWVHATDVRIFRDSGMDFDVNSYLIEGVSAKIHFNTGDLAGFEFELTSYGNTDKEFTLLKNSNVQDHELPSSTLKPAIGDKYVILDITMPTSYITTAETELQTKATTFINNNSDPRVNYLLTTDPKYFRENAISLKVGDKVTVVDSDLGIDKLVRIIRLTQSLYDLYNYTLEFSDQLEPQLIQVIISNQNEAERRIIISDVGDIYKARRNWRSTQELQNVIFDPDDYFDTGNIRPLSIETSMLTVANKSQQFFLKDIILQPNYTGDAAKFESSAGDLVHFTIESTIKTWNLASNSYGSLTAETVYYIYARCNRSTSAGQIILDSTQRKIDDGDTYYYFLIGVLHSVSDSVRVISLTYGFTRISGKFITTGEIKSQDGNTKFNLDTGVITGKITFIAGTDGYENISDKPGVTRTFIQATAPTPENIGDLWISTAEGNLLYRWNGSIWEAIQDEDVAQALLDAANAQTTADSKIKTWIQATAPTPSTVGDLWLDTDDGVLYRWSGSIWEETADNTKTVIDGGLITSGRIELGSGGTIKAGINGYGTAGGEIRIWAGATYANRATAPFRVNQDGEVVGTKGTFGGWTLATDAIYTGSKHTEPGYSTSGVTHSASGGLHAKKFYINDDGVTSLSGMHLTHLINKSASSTTRHADDAEESVLQSTPWVKIKQFSFTHGILGSFRTLFQAKKVEYTSGNVYARIYKNGVAYGTQQVCTETYQQFSQNFTVDLAPGNTIELWVYAASGNDVYVKEFRIAYDNNFLTAVPVVNT